MTWNALNEANEAKTRAQERRNQGRHTGKSAAGWEFKRPLPELGTFDRWADDTKASLRAHWANVLEEYNRAAHPERYEIPF